MKGVVGVGFNCGAIEGLCGNWGDVLKRPEGATTVGVTGVVADEKEPRGGGCGVIAETAVSLERRGLMNGRVEYLEGCRVDCAFRCRDSLVNRLFGSRNVLNNCLPRSGHRPVDCHSWNDDNLVNCHQ